MSSGLAESRLLKCAPIQFSAVRINRFAWLLAGRPSGGHLLS